MRGQPENPPDRGSGRPRIAFVCWRGAIGGTETHSHLLARELRAIGIDASILFIEGGGPLTARLERDDVPWQALEFPRGSAVLRHPRRLLKAVRAVAPDGLVLPDVGLLGAALRLLGYSGPVVAVDHGSLLQLASVTPFKRVRLRIARAAARSRGYEHVVVSETMRKEALRAFRGARCSLIYNGVELPSRPTPLEYTPGDQLVLGITGRLAVGKGIEFAIRAISDSDARLRIAGDGPDRVRLESLTRELGVESQVEFLGWVDDIPGFWRLCHAGIVPSTTHAESFALSAVEAMAAGRPVIASRQPALVEVTGTSGLLVALGSSSAIREQIRRLLDQPERLQQLGLQARERAEQLFDVRRCALAYAELLQITTAPRMRDIGSETDGSWSAEGANQLSPRALSGI
jgi:glycosyltransferase involved in cell wall biosynthesis